MGKEYVRLSKVEYRNKILGCWLGKNIGGTLGLPYEGVLDVLHLSFYDPVPDEPLGNDDLDLQLVWMHTLVAHGIDITEHDLREAWLDHVKDPHPDEYNKCMVNMQKGLQPPVCGWFNNAFTDCMGAPIRSEVWATICPGCPDKAVEYAYKDGICDHHDEGLYGELFLVALESAAFCESNMDVLLDLASSYIPSDSRVMWGVNCVREQYKKGTDWKTVRTLLVQEYNTTQMTYAPINVAFMVLGLLYGTDFDTQLCTAVNCGYDTDCTGATVGSILGILHGADAIPRKWIEVIGTHIKYDLQLVNFDVYDDVEKLTDDTVKVGYEVLLSLDSMNYFKGLDGDDILFNEHSHIKSQQPEYEKPRDTLVLPFAGGTALLSYNGMPTIGYGETKVLSLESQLNDGIIVAGDIGISGPTGWNLDLQENGATYDIIVSVSESPDTVIATSNTISIEVSLPEIGTQHIDFVLLGKAVWLVSPVKPTTGDDDFANVYNEEIDGHLDESDPDVETVQLDDESLVDLFGEQKNGLLYAQTSVYFPEERTLNCYLDCNDGAAVWFEGKCILSTLKHDEIIPAAHRRRVPRVEITVKKGWNTFFLKLMNNQDNYEGYFFFAKSPPNYMGYPDICFDAFEKSRSEVLV
jgi:ADP-ribosylglycohydrolase